jgi:hypothetical protein
VTEFAIQFEEGLLFAEIGGRRCLLDTGSPVSIGEGGPITIGDREHAIETGYLGVGLATIREHVTHPFDVLLGADVLCSQRLELDLPKGVCRLTDTPAPDAGRHLPVRSVMGVPVVTVEVDGHSVDAFFDTGASHSFLPPDLLGDPQAGDRIEEFLPQLGRFETWLRPVAVTLSDLELGLRCGALPELLQMALGIGGASGILGNELLLQHRVSLDLPNSVLAIDDVA